MNSTDNSISFWRDNFQILPPSSKMEKHVVPYLTLAVTKKCNLRCLYCGEGGELTASKKDIHEISLLFETIQDAITLGIKKIRVTGGEPFEYPQIKELLRYLQDTGLYVLVNTNGTVPVDDEFLDSLKGNVHFAVHLDTLNEAKFDYITSSRGFLPTILKNIERLSCHEKLLRLNRVHSKSNENELYDLISYCSKLGTNLKTYDITRVPSQFCEKNDMFVPLLPAEKELAEKASVQILHDYAKSFGTPCKIYRVNDVDVTVKSVEHGSRFDRHGYCKNCPYFPCDEGLYDIFYYPDGRLWGCRWYDGNIKRGNFKEELLYLIRSFQRARWYVEGKLVT